ncbi:hypothetical protein Mmc1_1958 [Magnetococcus marinus MC-1]|uniref:Glycosyltransferase RgtA/B/C/D-like domain-containing protein n=1 Tax=Magnetococcus marinus (strain ATCC BAA-1437 / JCM 17883 / MC-1) TaxID=156889 RepID=A0L923_MAGMM|nr:hypothetical protein Mmc1_1958 [Magnetococcus marinus MC-1]
MQIGWPLLCGFLLIFTVTHLTWRLAGVWAGALAGLMLACNPLILENSMVLGVDLPLTLLMFLTALWGFLGRGGLGNRPADATDHAALFGLLFSLTLILSAMAKLTTIWLIPWAFILLTFDMVQKKNFKFWLWAALSGVALLVLYLGYYAWQTGDPLYRIHSVEVGHNTHPKTYANKSWDQILDRLGLETLLFILTKPSLLIGFLFPWLVVWIVRDEKRDQIFFWLSVSVALLVMFWFGSTSLQIYNPMHLKERYLLPILPGMIMLSAVVLAKISCHSNTLKYRSLWLSALASVAFALFVLLKQMVEVKSHMLLLSGALLVVLALHLLRHRLPQWMIQLAPLPLMVALIVLGSLHVVQHRHEIPSFKHSLALKQQLLAHIPRGHLEAPVTVWSDDRSARALASLGSVYQGLNIVELKHFERKINSLQWVVVNRGNAHAEELSITPEVAKQLQHWPVIEQREGVVLLKAP